MKYSLMLLVALLLLVGCASTPPAAQGDIPADQPSIAQPSASNAPEPTATVQPSPISETAVPATPVTSETAVPASTAAAEPTPVASPVGQLPPAEAKAIIAPTAQQAVEAVKNRDMTRIAGMAHPEKGIRFSPYGFMQESFVVLKSEELTNALSDPTIRNWGSYDGTGEPIDLTFAAYFERFVYSQDFAAAPQIGYNQALKEIYRAEDFAPNSIMVEYHFPGFEPQYEGMDWQSLRLVFEQQEQSWYLVGILHNQWTI